MWINPRFGIGFALCCCLGVARGQNTRLVTCYGTDDRAAVQAIINSSSPGDTVEFGNGQTCAVSADGNSPGLTFPGGRTYHGSGTEIRLTSSTSGYPLIGLPNGNADNTTVDGLVLNANNVGVAVMHIATIGGTGSVLTQNVNVQNCTFENAAGTIDAPRGAGIYSSIPFKGANISNNRFLNLAHGVSLSGGTDLTISGNFFNTITSGDAIFLPTYGPQARINVINNTGSNLYRMAIEIQGEAEGFSVDDVLVKGNDFENWMTPADPRASTGISLVFNGRNAKLLNNTLVNGGVAFGIEAGNPGLLVDGNMITGFPIGIALGGAGITVSNNILSSQSDTAIQLTNAAENVNAQILGNTSINAKNAGIACVQGNQGGSLFKGNVISRQGGAYPDDANVTFRGIITPGGLNAPLTIQNNTISQTASNPPAGFQFWGISIYGLYPRSVLDGNQITSTSNQQFGVGVNVLYLPWLDQSTVTNSTFTNLAFVSNGLTSAKIGIQNNLACGVGQSDPYLITSTDCSASGSAPTVAITSPTQNQVIAGTVTITASASASAGLSGVQFEVDGTAIGSPVSAPFQRALDTGTLSNGSHSVTAVAYDNSGRNTMSAPVTISVANAPPQNANPPIVSFVAPPPNQTVGGTVGATVSAAGDAGVARLRFKVDGMDLNPELTAAPYTLPVDTSTLSNGTHTLAATAQDSIGQSTTATRLIVVSNPAAPVPAFCPGPATNAFTGCYYSDTPNFFQKLDLVRTDPAINFNWSQDSPDPSVPRTFFSVKWAGTFTFNSGTYVFTATADDGVRVWVDGHLLIDYWSDEAATTYNGSIQLSGGSHLVEMTYFQSGGAAVAQLSWRQ